MSFRETWTRAVDAPEAGQLWFHRWGRDLSQSCINAEIWVTPRRWGLCAEVDWEDRPPRATVTAGPFSLIVGREREEDMA